MENKKILIQEFHEFTFPNIITRDLKLPADINKIITVTDSRRVGKTFYFYQLIKAFKDKVPFTQILYVNFENERILPLSSKDLNELLEAYFEIYPENKDKENYFFFDEIQNIKG